MKITSYYPVILTGDVPGSATFYVTHFRFKPLFTSDWYVHLQSLDSENVNLAVLDGQHETVPNAARGRVSGLILNFEVEDPDAEYARVRADPGIGSGRARAAGLRLSTLELRARRLFARNVVNESDVSFEMSGPNASNETSCREIRVTHATGPMEVEPTTVHREPRSSLVAGAVDRSQRHWRTKRVADGPPRYRIKVVACA